MKKENTSFEKRNRKLLDLTNKFLNEFYSICKNDFNDTKSFTYNFTLPEILIKSDITLHEENVSCLIPMSSFESNYIKGITNIYLKNFPSNVKNLIDILQQTELNKLSTDSCKIDNYKQENKKVEDIEVNFIDGNWIPSKILVDEYVTSFDISNNRNSFIGEIIIFERDEKVFINDNEFVVKRLIKDIHFRIKDICVFSITLDERFDKLESTIHDFSHVKNINSFFYLISNF